MVENWFKLHYPHITNLMKYGKIYDQYFSSLPAKIFELAILFPSNKMRVIAGNLWRMRVKASENFECGWKYRNVVVTRQMRLTWHICTDVTNWKNVARKTFFRVALAILFLLLCKVKTAMLLHYLLCNSKNVREFTWMSTAKTLNKDTFH